MLDGEEARLRMVFRHWFWRFVDTGDAPQGEVVFEMKFQGMVEMGGRRGENGVSCNNVLQGTLHRDGGRRWGH